MRLHRFALGLALLPQPAVAADPGKHEPVPHLTRTEYEATLAYWGAQFPDRCRVRRIGESREGMGIYRVEITDSTITDETKQHCLITALHGGPERSGTTSCLRVIEWLLSDHPEARETRKKQAVWVLPLVNPYAYFETDRFGNSLKIDPYTGGGLANWDLESLTFRSLERAPELRAFLETVDEFRPEAHLDLHGTGLQEYPDDRLGARERYQGQIMTEITGSAYSNFALRPWDWRVTEAMVRAGEEAGFPSDRFEADAQRLLSGTSTAPLAALHWRGRAQFYSAQYGYAKYHTLIAALEVAWEESALVRTKAWLRFGNRVASGENREGYPVDRLKAFVGHYVTATGETASARRDCRERLWQNQAAFSQGFLYPQTDGRILYAVGTTPESGKLLAGDLETFLARLESHDPVDASAIRAFIETGPEIKMAVEAGKAGPPSRPAVQDESPPSADPVEHGIGFRLRIPYPDARVDEISLNGHPLPDSATNGFEVFPGNGFTQIQVNLDAATARKARQLFIVACRYTPPQSREIGWRPPREVLERLEDTNPDSDSPILDPPKPGGSARER